MTYFSSPQEKRETRTPPDIGSCVIDGPHRQDVVKVSPTHGIAVLADGTSDVEERTGNRGAVLATEWLTKYLKEGHSMVDAFAHTNQSLYQEGAGDYTSAAIAAQLRYDEKKGKYSATIGHIGDARAYLFDNRSGELRIITRDHSIFSKEIPDKLAIRYQERAASLDLGPGDMARIPEDKNLPLLDFYMTHANRISQALGGNLNNHPSINEIELNPGDKILIMSDGVYEGMPHGLMENIVKQYRHLPSQVIAETLANEAEKRAHQQKGKYKVDDRSIVVMSPESPSASNRRNPHQTPKANKELNQPHGSFFKKLSERIKNFLRHPTSQPPNANERRPRPDQNIEYPKGTAEIFSALTTEELRQALLNAGRDPEAKLVERYQQGAPPTRQELADFSLTANRLSFITHFNKLLKEKPSRNRRPSFSQLKEILMDPVFNLILITPETKVSNKQLIELVNQYEKGKIAFEQIPWPIKHFVKKIDQTNQEFAAFSRARTAEDLIFIAGERGGVYTSTGHHYAPEVLEQLINELESGKETDVYKLPYPVMMAYLRIKKKI